MERSYWQVCSWVSWANELTDDDERLIRPANLYLRNNRTMNRVKANSNRRLPNNTQAQDGQFTLHISAFDMKNERF
ncbi:MAG: hypothetical protein DME22_24015 [Verrucomicrobia bacterium]|nr:MAG: hypothetical protein DME22_24015 [Verrucomicrobiota bacterium]